MQSNKQLQQDFYELCKIEPRLKNLENAVIYYVKKNRKAMYYHLDKWYGFGKFRGDGIKPLLVKLVGWSAENPALSSSKDYDTAYDYLYGLISSPNTRKMKQTD
ncbi:MAG: hypothetical protein FWF79_00425 [Defluviitaleaceae bacterium]|nr:hypothetical protein [Defluviitaleaceae bacterium]